MSARIDSYTAVELPEFFGRDDLAPGLMFVSPAPTSMVHFLCPCGCGVQYDLPVNRHASWTLSLAGDKPTISPSVFNRAPGGCNSHFFIRGGVVQWA